MAAATLILSESNGPAETVTDGIETMNFGSVDAPDLDPNMYPIAQGKCSFFKMQRLKIVDMGDSSELSNFQSARDTFVGGFGSTYGWEFRHFATGLAETPPAYSQPNRVLIATGSNRYPETLAQMHFNGAMGEIITAPQYSDYLKTQLQVLAGADEGPIIQQSFVFQYDEE
jgi:hypothetical protein